MGRIQRQNRLGRSWRCMELRSSLEKEESPDCAGTRFGDSSFPYGSLVAIFCDCIDQIYYVSFGCHQKCTQNVLAYYQID